MKIAYVDVGCCAECPNYDQSDSTCAITEEVTGNTEMPDNCPLDDA